MGRRPSGKVAPASIGLLALGVLACTSEVAPASPTSGPSGTEPSPATAAATPSWVSSAPSESASPPVPPEGRLEHPTGPTDVVLRMFEGDGYWITEWAFLEAPLFTLYGDGTAVFMPSHDYGMSDDYIAEAPPFVKATMKEEQVDALLRFALGPGGLAEADAAYENPDIHDAGTTVLTVNAGGVDKVVDAYALAAAWADEPAVVAKLRVLADMLDSFEEEVAKGNVESTEPYQPTRYVADQHPTTRPGGLEPLEWPWDDIAVRDIDDGYLTPEQVALASEIPTGGIAGILVEAPGGTLRRLSFRPLLPDEPPIHDGDWP